LAEESDQQTGAGILYVVATPIGNLEDISRRAIRILTEVDLIAAEDTRQTRKLLASLDIHTRMVSYHKDREQAQAAKLLGFIRSGKNLALVSDAGTPGLSDPGAILVRQASAAGVKLVPVPGPSALAAAVSVAALPGSGFVFLGFLPGKGGERKRLLQPLSVGELPIIFYEAPHRLLKTLRDCLEIFGDREVFIGRELSKIHEELLHRRLSELVADFADRREIKGELVVIVKGAPVVKATPETGELPEVIAWYRDHSALSLRDASRKIAADLGLSRSEVYSRALELWKQGDEIREDE